MNIVITMGGLGARFREAGYNVPKYMIEVRGKTLFEWSLLSLRGFADCAKKYIFLALADAKTDAKEFIEEKCDALGIQNRAVIILESLTDGQATTALLAAPYWDAADSLLIYNIDTYVEEGAMRSSQVRGEGFIPCFRAEGEHWSFVRLGADGEAAEVAEKRRISENCTIGAYYFASGALYERLYREYYGENRVEVDSSAQKAHTVNGEKYVAPLYNQLIADGGRVYIAYIPSEKVHVLGTPQELETFRA